jgi:DNA-binding CsgD family transcriptional regulator/pimeloyl-ACP methyl ester carboxylesterase
MLGCARPLTLSAIIVGKMNAPPLQFTRTSDGVSIAYTVAGSGPLLILARGTTTSHTELLWRSPGLRAAPEQLSAFFTVLQFDWRNTGSSTRGAPFGRDEWLRDLDAVFSLFDGPADLFISGPQCVPYVADNPNRIRRLVTWNQHRWPERHRYVGAMLHHVQLSGIDPDPSWSRLLGRKFAGEVPEPTHREIEELFVSCCDRGYSAQVQPMIASWDLAPYLERIAVPTLVVHRRGLGAEIGVDYAAHIPGALLHLVEGSSWFMPGEEDPLPAILTFLTSNDERPLSVTSATATGAVLDGLSGREAQVLKRIAAGNTNSEIAGTLVLSPRTVERHIQNIYNKLGVHNRVEAANWAREHGIVP